MVSVITNEDGWYKRAANSFLVIPKFAVMNPEITFTLPEATTAREFSRYYDACVSNAILQTSGMWIFTDRLCEAVLKQ